MGELSHLIRLRILASQAKRRLERWTRPRQEHHAAGEVRAALARRQSLPPRTGHDWHLIWQADPAGLWETDWLRWLLAPLGVTEVMDGRHRVLHDSMIVVDNQLSAEKADYYRRAFEAGSALALVHLSDEWYRDDCAAYAWCNVVIRNYWTAGYDGLRNVVFFPVGYKAGFRPLNAQRSADRRRHFWCFAGDPYKTTRADMLRHMRRIGPGFEHLTHGFNAADGLAVEAYRAMLEDSVLVPAPCGNENLESFRVWEALEAGCIPIVERRPGLDYFTHLLGEHPLPTVQGWNEAGRLVDELRAEGFENRRRRCQLWWAAKKQDCSTQIAAALKPPDNQNRTVAPAITVRPMPGK